MHSITMPSLPVVLTITSFIASSTPYCPFLSLIPLRSPLRQTQYPDATTSNVLSRLVSFSPITFQPFAAQGADVANTVYAVDPCCTNTVHAKHELVQPRPCPGGLVFHPCGWPSLPPASLVPFPEQMSSTVRSVQGVYPYSCLRFSNVLGAVLPTRLEFSVLDTFSYTRVPFEHSYSPRFGSNVFRGGGVQARLPRKMISLCWGAPPPVDAVGRLVLSA